MSNPESIHEVLTQFDPQPDELLREICGHINDEMLQQISLADYGEEKDEHLAALRNIRDTGTSPIAMEWCPTEVLELIRWSQPDDPNWKPGSTGEFGHWMRAFCAAVLLRALREPSNYDIGTGNDVTLAHLILSLRILPVNLNRQAVSFLSWLLLHSDLEGSDEQVFSYGVGLLWFALQLPTASDDVGLASLAKWIIRRSKELYPDLIFGLNRSRAASFSPSAWKTLGEAMFDLDLNSHSPELRASVELIAAELAS